MPISTPVVPSNAASPPTHSPTYTLPCKITQNHTTVYLQALIGTPVGCFPCRTHPARGAYHHRWRAVHNVTNDPATTPVLPHLTAHLSRPRPSAQYWQQTTANHQLLRPPKTLLPETLKAEHPAATTLCSMLQNTTKHKRA